MQVLIGEVSQFYNQISFILFYQGNNVQDQFNRHNIMLLLYVHVDCVRNKI